MKFKERKCGFTLIELLVVISIIALLMSVMMPALSRARQLAQGVVCKSRLRDIGLATHSYINDYSGLVPPSANPGERWMAKLSDYVYKRKGAGTANYSDHMSEGGIYDFELFRCPVEVRKAEKKGYDNNNYYIDGAYGLYGYNQYFTGDGMIGNHYSVVPNNSKQANAWRKFDSIISPASLPFFADTNSDGDANIGVQLGGCWWLSAKGPHPMAYSKYNWNGGVAKQYQSVSEWAFYGPAPNHGARTNYLMADGHTDTLDIWPWQDHLGTDFHPKRNVEVKPPTPPSGYWRN